MLRHALNAPWVYSLSQFFWYRAGEQERYVREWIRPRAGDRILDIGCGPASVLDRLPTVSYVGYDPSPQYIAHATARFGARGRFHCGHILDLPEEDIGTFDIVLANGVLHHVSDDTAEQLLSLARKALKPKGRLVTRDGCFESGQGRLARFLLRSDRGGFVRSQAAYEALIKPHFKLLRSDILRKALRLPYSLIHFELEKS